MSAAKTALVLAGKADLLRYFGARNLAVLERQFNADGRLNPVMLDAADKALLVATSGAHPRVVGFPIHVSDLLGLVELERRQAEMNSLV